MNSSQLKYIFLLLVIAGVVVPYLAFVPWVMEHGLDLRLLAEQAGASHIAAFAWRDVVVSAVALLVVTYSKQFISLRQAVIVTVLTLAAGVSAGLPMLFYFVVADKEKKQQ